MSGLSPLHGNGVAIERTRSASSFQFVHDQIDALRRQVAGAVEKGALTPAHGAEINADLDDIQRSVDKGAADRSMTRADLRQVSTGLHEIRQYIMQANRTAAGPADSGTAGRRPNGVDITV